LSHRNITGFGILHENDYNIDDINHDHDNCLNNNHNHYPNFSYKHNHHDSSHNRYQYHRTLVGFTWHAAVRRQNGDSNRP
jgi:hypothetical protein